MIDQTGEMLMLTGAQADVLRLVKRDGSIKPAEQSPNRHLCEQLTHQGLLGRWAAPDSS